MGCPATAMASFSARETRTARHRGVVVALPGRGIAAARRDEYPVVDLRLLGGFRLMIDGEPVAVSPTGQRLLAVLACRDRLASRDHIAAALWPEVPRSRARTNLRSALHRLARTCPAPVVHVTSRTVQLADGARVDLEQSTQVASRVLNGPVTDEVVSVALGTNLSDELLPGWVDEWLTDHQDSHHQRRLAALQALSYWLAVVGRPATTVSSAPATLHAAVIRSCLAQGDRHAAFLHYARCRRVLRQRLGLDPAADQGRLLTVP